MSVFSILLKLEDLGWGVEFQQMSEYDWKKFKKRSEFHQPRALTTRGKNFTSFCVNGLFEILMILQRGQP